MCYDTSYLPHSVNVNCPIFTMPRITADGVRNILCSLEPSTSSGYDNISAQFLIKCADHISEPLANLFNLSIDKGEYPAILKYDHVVPIYKRKGSKYDIDCYRGITIQPIIAKIFEGFINRALRVHLKPLIIENQHGFMKDKSCTSNLLYYTDFITKSFDNKSQTHTIYTDFQKAFDVVPHHLLLHKLNMQFGIENNMFKWFSSYLSNRFHRVVIDGISSEWYNVTSGVPQGSVLGPTLFLCYINDIAHSIKYSQFLLFADDTKLFKDIKSYDDCTLLQDDIDCLLEWCRTWHMKLNIDKCAFMNFTLKRSRDIVTNYFIDDIALDRCYEMKDLGVYFSPNLCFNNHINKITSKARQMLGFLKRVTDEFTNPKTLRILYYSLVRSRLEYCSQVWSPSSVNMIIKIERVQKYFLKYLSFKQCVFYNDYDYQSLCSVFNMQSLESRRNITDLRYLNKILTNHVDCSYLVGEISLSVPRRVLRAKPTFAVQYRLLCRKTSFFPRVFSEANRRNLYDDLIMNEPDDFKRLLIDLLN